MAAMGVDTAPAPSHSVLAPLSLSVIMESLGQQYEYKSSSRAAFSLSIM